MEFTGFDYRFYSDKSNIPVAEKFNQLIKSLNYTIEETKEDKADYLNFFYFRDQEMYDHHLEHGYNVDLDGEGCIWFTSGRGDITGKYIVDGTFDPAEEFNQTVGMFFDEVFCYTLTLPGDIEENPFSKSIYDYVESLLKDDDLPPGDR